MQSPSPIATTRLRAAQRLLVLLVAVLGLLVGTTAVASATSHLKPPSQSGAGTVSVSKTRVGVAADLGAVFVGSGRSIAAGHVGETCPRFDGIVSGSCVATKPGGVSIEGAGFAQTTARESFSGVPGRFAGQTIDDVAGGLRSGALRPGDVPIEVIVRDGNTLILNTRSALALEQAGIPRSSWNVVNMTGDAAAEARLTGQLTRNGLGSSGTPTVRRTGR